MDVFTKTEFDGKKSYRTYSLIDIPSNYGCFGVSITFPVT